MALDKKGSLNTNEHVQESLKSTNFSLQEQKSLNGGDVDPGPRPAAPHSMVSEQLQSVAAPVPAPAPAPSKEPERPE